MNPSYSKSKESVFVIYAIKLKHTTHTVSSISGLIALWLCQKKKKFYKTLTNLICLCRFATRERSALLLYNGRFNEKHDFIALEIIDEQIQLTFSGG